MKTYQSSIIYPLLEKLNQINTVIPSINAGGCGVFAHALGKELRSAGLNVNIVSLGYKQIGRPEPIDERVDATEAFNNFKNTGKDLTPHNLHNSGVQINHLLVEVFDEIGQPRYIDSNGIYTAGLSVPPKFPKYPSMVIDGRMSIEDCKELIDVKRGWNENFDRNFIPKVYEIVKKCVNSFKELRPNQLQLNFGY